MDARQITIRALKYGNVPHYEWNTTLLELTDSHIFVLGERGRKLTHHTKGKEFIVEHRTIEFFSFDSWFTVSADMADGEIRQYYCNINEPAVLKDSLVSFVDLDLDLVYRGGEWKVVDEDEFEANRVKFRYPDELAKRARLELERLQLRVKEGRFPFDGTLNRFMPLMDGEGR